MSDVCESCGHELEDGRCPACADSSADSDPWADGLIDLDDPAADEETGPGAGDDSRTGRDSGAADDSGNGRDSGPANDSGNGRDSGAATTSGRRAQGELAEISAARIDTDPELAVPEPRPAPAGPRRSPSRHRVVRGDREEDVREVLEELRAHRRENRGLRFGIAGLAEHGKTQLMDRLRALRYREYRSGASVVKTRGGAANIWTIPSRGAEHKVVDVSGEDFVKLGLAARGASDVELPGQPEPLHEWTRALLWGALQLVDGLIVLVSLPRLWSGLQRHRPAPEADVQKVREAMRSFEAATIGLLKLAAVAADRGRLGRKFREILADPDHVPDRNEIGYLIDAAKPLRLPVFLGFSFADCFEGGLRGPDGQFADSPRHEDAWTLADRVFPRLSEYLFDHVKYYKWDHVQALSTGTVDRVDQHQEIATMIGAESALEFLAGHAWWLPGLSTARWLRRGRRLGGAA